MMTSANQVVIASLDGGLANQMFQYAAGRALATKWNAELLLDIRAYETYKPWGYGLDALQIQAKVATPEQLAQFSGNRFGQRIRRALPVFFSHQIRREKHFHFDDDFFDWRPPVRLEGYFQSEKYFASVATQVRAEFQLKQSLADENLKFARQIEDHSGGPAVSLHIRRGDYVSNPQALQVHGLTPLDYYNESLSRLKADLGDFRVFAFSDDPEWTRQNIKWSGTITFISHNGKTPAEDLRLMSMCDHHIMANSSFSWWGAWLNPKLNKKVIAPLRWFHGRDDDTKDLCPQGWIRL